MGDRYVGGWVGGWVGGQTEKQGAVFIAGRVFVPGERVKWWYACI